MPSTASTLYLLKSRVGHQKQEANASAEAGVAAEASVDPELSEEALELGLTVSGDAPF